MWGVHVLAPCFLAEISSPGGGVVQVSSQEHLSSHLSGETEARIYPPRAVLGWQSMPPSRASGLIATSGTYPCEAQSAVS